MRRTSPTLAAVCGVLGFLLVMAASSAQATRRAQAPRKATLIEIIEQRREQVDELDALVADLRSRVAAAEQEAAQRDRLDRDQARWLAELAAQAGTTAVRGPGIKVTLRDSDREPTSSEEAGAYRIRDSDIQLVVNALFGAGAEAVAVNDTRIVSTTAIRSAGGTVVVNFRPLSPPYEIVAIGAQRDRFAASDIARRFRRWSTLFGLGFSLDPITSATVPAYTGRVAIASALPVTEQDAG